ncbi:MAG: protein kinase [Candidatus Acidoferrales bacterium]
MPRQMALSPGIRLGPYEILAPLGVGGMGEVYRARDTRLDRTVAIKVLPAHLSENARLRQRFEREARALASLSHPHICTLHDVGHENGVHFLVMEYLEGETLAARVEKGPLPTEQVLRAGIEIADALDKAHRQGVIHRDLKPGNIMLTKTGAKLLDFGLAKAATNLVATALTKMSTAPTQSQPITTEGTILGTLHYMAPEQLEGREVDTRSDIFALGAVLYEMGTGRKAFSGQSQASVIAAILSSEPPPMATLQPMTPPALDRAVKRCLGKDPEERWQSARDLMLELKWVQAGPAAEVPAPGIACRRRRERLAWVAAVLALATALGLAIVYFNRPTRETHTTRFSVSLPENAEGVFSRVSPDGRYLAFSIASGGQRQLWLRPLNAVSAQPLPGTEGARFPFWSPDSRLIGFFAEGKLQKIDVAGGPPQILCDAPGVFSMGTWSRNGTILFSVFEAPGQEGLHRVSAAGGAPTRMTILDESEKELLPFYPSFLPDGRHFIFRCAQVEDGSFEDRGICVASLDSGRARQLVDARSPVSRAEYAPPGYLLYARGETLLAHPFDANKLRLQGEPLTIAAQVEHYGPVGLVNFSVSESGVLAYQAGGSQSRLLWKDRKGQVIGEVGDPAEYFDVRLSPDGQKLAVSIRDLQALAGDIWIIELARNVATRFTTVGPQSEAFFPLWSPDGSRIVFCMPRDAPPFLHQKPLAGGEKEVLLPSSGTLQCPTDWSPDSRFILYMDRHPDTNADLWILPLAGERKPIPFLRTRFSEMLATFSPDGRWVAFVSDESGRPEVYVQPFEGPGERRRVSTAGGFLPRWRRDGKELFYLGVDNQLMVVPVKLGVRFELGTPQALFPVEAGPSVGSGYDVTADGHRFIVISAMPGTAVSPTVVLNWTAELPR